MNLNKILLCGRVGRDAETAGTGGVKFSICVNESWQDKNSGEWLEKPTWFEVIHWTKSQEKSLSKIKKGAVALIEGKMENNKWTDKNGQTRDGWQVNARRVQITTPAPRSTAPPTPQQIAKKYDGPPPPHTNDELPF